MTTKIKAGLIVAALLAGGFAVSCGLTACGGGGGGSDDGGTPNPNPPTNNGGNNPGENPKQLILGAADDNPHNRVPDDVDAWIASVAPNSAKTRAALTQDAGVITDQLLDADDASLSRDHARQEESAISCIRFILGQQGMSVIKQADLTDQLRSKFLSTRDRIKTYTKYDGQLGGIYSDAPDDGSTCTFDLDSLPN
jgi:hypothetical protein